LTKAEVSSNTQSIRRNQSIILPEQAAALAQYRNLEEDKQLRGSNTRETEEEDSDSSEDLNKIKPRNSLPNTGKGKVDRK